MQFDPNNKVIQLCAQGMSIEAEGKTEEAHQLFQQAWDIAANDFESFTAAHYLARNQKEPADNLKWNIEALNRALAINEEGIKGHYPSLYLNVAKSYENMNELMQARNFYQLAASNSSSLPSGQYGDMIKSGIAAGLQRTANANFNHPAIDELINKWCERKELKPLSFILPAYIGNLGTEADTTKIISALSYLSATRCLVTDEQEIIDKVIIELSGNRN